MKYSHFRIVFVSGHDQEWIFTLNFFSPDITSTVLRKKIYLFCILLIKKEMNEQLIKNCKVGRPDNCFLFLALCWCSDAQAWAGALHTAR